MRSKASPTQSHFSQSLDPDPADPQSSRSTSSNSNDSRVSAQSPFERPQGTTTTRTSTMWSVPTQDTNFVEHLLDVYFTWVHPFCQLFSAGHFKSDMTGGMTGFCSGILVNAILATACNYSDRPCARSNPDDPATAGDRFFEEAKRLLDETTGSSLTTIQALGIMSTRETLHGRDGNGYQYGGRCVRMALEMGLHLSTAGRGLSPSEMDARQITFWGVFNLET